MNAAWLQGVRDLLNWVLGDEYVSPLRNRFMVRPPLDPLTSTGMGPTPHSLKAGRLCSSGCCF